MKKQHITYNTLLQCCEHIRQLNHLLNKAKSYSKKQLSRSEWAQLCEISELELNQTIKAGRRAESRLFRAYKGLIISIAKQYRFKADLNDLIQEGFLGLRKAATRYDPKKGYEFSTYAFWWIRDAIQVALKNNLFEENCTSNCSLDSLKPWEADQIETQVVNVARTTPIDSFEFREIREHLAHLTDYEQQLIRYRYGLDENKLTLKEIGTLYNVSHETVRRHVNYAIAKLRELYNMQECA